MHITVHMISSVDGRLHPQRWSIPDEPVDISQCYEGCASRLDAQGWIVGRVTMAELADCIREEAPAGRRAAGDVPVPHLGDRRSDEPLAVAVDPKGRLHFTDCRLPSGEHILVMLSETVDEMHLEELRNAGVSYVFAGTDGADLRAGLAQIESLTGVHSLLLEGGGVINGAFLAADLIDEVSVLIFPGLDGLYGEPSIFGYRGAKDDQPARGCRLRLRSTEVLPGGVVWLRYSVHR